MISAIKPGLQFRTIHSDLRFAAKCLLALEYKNKYFKNAPVNIAVLITHDIQSISTAFLSYRDVYCRRKLKFYQQNTEMSNFFNSIKLLVLSN